MSTQILPSYRFKACGSWYAKGFRGDGIKSLCVGQGSLYSPKHATILDRSYVLDISSLRRETCRTWICMGQSEAARLNFRVKPTIVPSRISRCMHRVDD